MTTTENAAAAGAERGPCLGLVDGTLVIGVDPEGCHVLSVSITSRPSDRAGSDGRLELVLGPDGVELLRQALGPAPGTGHLSGPVPCGVGIRLGAAAG